MIPYFQWTEISLGPLTVYVWGFFVALGILVGAWVSARFAEKNGEKRADVYDTGLWIIGSAFIFARIVHIFAYEPGYYFLNPIEMFKVWQGGYSVIGGFFGAALGYTLFVKIKKHSWIAFADKIIYGLPIGLGIGRLGCFCIHDHPGIETSFFLGIQQPGGGAIHDHGLYLSINGFILAAIFAILSAKKRPDAYYLRFFMIWYGIVRFFLDFYRSADVGYFGLTPAQYFSIFMVMIGVAWTLRRYKPGFTGFTGLSG